MLVDEWFDWGYHVLVKLPALRTKNSIFLRNFTLSPLNGSEIRFLNFHCYVPEIVGFQNWLILYLMGMGYHPVGVSGLGFDFLFKSTWTHCADSTFSHWYENIWCQQFFTLIACRWKHSYDTWRLEICLESWDLDKCDWVSLIADDWKTWKLSQYAVTG